MSKTSENNDVWGRYWSQEGNFSNCVGFQANEAFLYISVGQIGAGDYIQCSQADMATWTHLFEYGISHESDIHDNRIYFNSNNAVLYYDRHGK